jgi:hypothetical protein
MTWEKLQVGPSGVIGVECHRVRTAGGWLVAMSLSGGLGRWLRATYVPDPAGAWIPSAWERVTSDGDPPGGSELHRTTVPDGSLIYLHTHGFSGPGGDLQFIPERGGAR